MSTLSFPVSHGASIGAPLLSVPIQDVFPFEVDFETAIMPRITTIAEKLGVDNLMIVGRQVATRLSERGKSPTMDLVLMDDSGRLYIVELKTSRERFSVSQAHMYASVLKGHDDVFVSEMYHDYLVKYQASTLTLDACIDQLTNFCGVSLEEMYSIETPFPALVVITPDVTVDELAVAEDLASRDVDVSLFHVELLQDGCEYKLQLNRFFPAPSAGTDGRRAARPSLGSAGLSAPLAHQHADAKLRAQILTVLEDASVLSEPITTTALRSRVQNAVRVKEVLDMLVAEGLVVREYAVATKAGRPPTFYSLPVGGADTTEDPVDDAPIEGPNCDAVLIDPAATA
jgi:hypothetical protein